MENTFKFYVGLKKIAKNITGSEIITIGIRPFGFHAGNEIALLTYPLILCDLVKKRGIKPKFTFIISINDMEPHSLKYLFFDNNDRPVYKTYLESINENNPYEYNIFPNRSSFQFTCDDKKCHNNIAEHWEEVIYMKLDLLKNSFPKVKIIFVQSSKLKNNKVFKKIIIDAIKFPRKFAELIKKYEPILDKKEFLNFAGAICNNCGSAQGVTKIIGNKVRFCCMNCKTISCALYENIEFWAHHLLILPARLKIFNVQIAIRGYDHYERHHIEINNDIYEKLFAEQLLLKTVITPMVMGADGKKMSKSRGNDTKLNSKLLVKLAQKCRNKYILI